MINVMRLFHNYNEIASSSRVLGTPRGVSHPYGAKTVGTRRAPGPRKDRGDAKWAVSHKAAKKIVYVCFFTLSGIVTPVVT